MRLTYFWSILVSIPALACGSSVEPPSGAGGAGGGSDPGPASGTATATAAGTGGAGAGAPRYFLALAAKLSPKKPFVLVAERLVDPDASSFRLNLQPLAAADRVTPVGESISVGPFDIGPGGSFTAALPSILLPAAANPINTSDLEATITLTTASGDPAPCGDVTGMVTKPLPLQLDGSTFTMVPVTTAATYPEPPEIDCAGELAVPVGEI